MIRWAVALLVCVLAGCTGQNVDENFIADHGASLAQMRCVGASTHVNSDTNLNWQANLFYDGSVIMQVKTSAGSPGTLFFSRNEVPEHYAVGFGPGYTLDGCGWNDGILLIESGYLKRYTCAAGTTPELASTFSLSSCTGFNKSLFE